MAAKIGDKVSVEYEGRFESGEVFDSSNKEGEIVPLVFIIGSGQVIKGFEESVVGMEEGEEREITVSPENGYGMPIPELKKGFSRDIFPKEEEPKEGMMIVMNTSDGQQIPARIDSVKEGVVIIDLNHPLAGKNLIFKIKLTKIESS